MPLTAAGVFAKDLLEGQWAAIVGYLAVGLTSAAVLGLAHAWVLARERAQRAEPAWQGDRVPRRAALGVAAGAALAYVGTYLAARLVPRQTGAASVLLVDPQEPVPSGGLDQPNPHPERAGDSSKCCAGSDPRTNWGEPTRAGGSPRLEPRPGRRGPAIGPQAGRPCPRPDQQR